MSPESISVPRNRANRLLDPLVPHSAHGVLGFQPAGSCFVDAEEFE
jgi:hypothetical protein